jgi:hypothetical protein
MAAVVTMNLRVLSQHLLSCVTFLSQLGSFCDLQVTVELQSPCSSLLLRSTGSSLAFPGYLAAWQTIDSSSSSNGLAAATAAEDGSDNEAAAVGEFSDAEDVDDVAALVGSKGSALSRVLQQLQQGQQVALLKVCGCSCVVCD